MHTKGYGSRPKRSGARFRQHGDRNDRVVVIAGLPRFWRSFSRCGHPAGISAYSSRFFGKPLRAISRFSHQNAPTPLLSVWEKGAGGMRGKRARGHPARCAPEARAPRASPLPAAGFSGSPCAPSPISNFRTPKRPLLPVWEKGAGGMRGNDASPNNPKFFSCSESAPHNPAAYRHRRRTR